MLKLEVLGSSSHGNCSIITDGESSVMIDCGINVDHILPKINADILDGVIITHSHGDHFKGCNHLASYVNCRFYMNSDCFNKSSIFFMKKVLIESEKMFKVGNYQIIPFEVYHDVLNYGFIIKHMPSGHKIVWITDSSSYSNLHFNDIDTFVVEANNSVEWIKDKENVDFKDFRTYSDYGHCSIEDTIIFLKENININTKNIILCHISYSCDDFREFEVKARQELGFNNIIALNPKETKIKTISLQKDCDINFD